MSAAETRTGAPAIPVVVELGPAWSRLDEGQAEAFRTRLKERLERFVSDLGIPGRIEIALVDGFPGTWVRLSVHGSPVLYSVELARRVWETVKPGGVGAVPPDWTLAELDGDPDLADGRVELLARLIDAAIRQRPEVLLGPEQIEEYAGPAPDLAAAGSALRRILSLWVSIDDRERILPKLRGGAAAESLAETVEELITGGSAAAVEVLLHPDYLEALTGAAPNETPVSAFSTESPAEVLEALERLTDDLFYTLGLRVPDVLLAADPGLGPGEIAFRLNQVVTAPRRGLRPDQYLVFPAPPDAGGGRTFHPSFYHWECAVTDDPAPPVPDGQAWNALEYLVLCLRHELETHGWRLVTVERVELELARLRDAFPALVSVALELVTPERSTIVLRDLLREGISIRDFRTVLERLLTYDYVLADTSRHIVFDDRFVAHESFEGHPWLRGTTALGQHVRAGLNQLITHKFTYSRGESQLRVFLLDADEEEKLRAGLVAGEDPGPEATAELLEAIGAVVAPYRLTQHLPSILTLGELRGHLRRLVEPIYPRLAVLSYDELSPDTSILALTRISVD